MARLGRADLERDLNFRFARRNLLVTLHPETVGQVSPGDSATRLLAVLDRFPDLALVITKSNADTGGRDINRVMEAYAAANPDRVLIAASLGQQRYLSVMAVVDAVVGNSSSGIIEAPAMGKPTVNIGRRQQGRARAPSVIDCPDETDAIARGVERALSVEMQSIASRKESPYQGGGASKRIKDVLATADLGHLTEKSFRTLH
jgi:UDP-hydrolysing UDP-N-acetyl-D-glucosamine 2-epimerase